MNRRSTLGRLAPAVADALAEWGSTASSEAYTAAWTQLHALAAVARWARAAHLDDHPPWPRHQRMERAIARLECATKKTPSRRASK